jgi:hypothetical protein
MSNTAATAIAVLAAPAAAASFGVAGALQHRQARLTPEVGGVRLLARLAARPLWLAGIALASIAYGLQALALAFGPLALVAPIVATDLLFALPVAARWSRPLRAREWLGCVLAAGGVAAFLAAAPPSPGRSGAPARDWLVAFAVVGLACAAGAVAAIAGIVLLGRYAGTPVVRTAAKQAGSVAGKPRRSAAAGAGP